MYSSKFLQSIVDFIPTTSYEYRTIKDDIAIMIEIEKWQTKVFNTYKESIKNSPLDEDGFPQMALDSCGTNPFQTYKVESGLGSCTWSRGYGKSICVFFDDCGEFCVEEKDG